MRNTSTPTESCERFAFVLLSHFSMTTLGSALDVLSQANEASLSDGGGMLYDVLLASVDGRSVKSSMGASVVVDCKLDDLPTLDGLFVVSDRPLPQVGFDPLVAYLRTADVTAKLLGSLGTGAFLLARAGLLSGYRATLHWAYGSLLAELFPDTLVSSNVFESDRQRLTCAGGFAPFDMMLHLIGQTHGPDIVQQVLENFSLERARGINEPQRVPLISRIGGGQPKLTEAVTLMESNVGEPLPTEEIARLVGVSRRQLERLFKQYLDSLPARYYLEIRLRRAREQLQQTSQSILQVALSCGFSSGPHFSNTYRAHFGVTPREQRSLRVAMGTNTKQEPQGESH